MPLHPGVYADLLGAKMKKHGAKVWLLNTGWTGGPVGTGQRIKLAYTRRMVTAALTGELDGVDTWTDPIFGLAVPNHIEGVPDKLLHPRDTWQSPAEYADRERFLHLAVRAAAERGELPTSAVADALTGRGGWEARLHPVDQELVIQRASAAHLEAVWKRAVEAEALAWHDAQVARRDWQSLCQESILAAAHAAAVQHLLPGEPVLFPSTVTHSAPVARVA
jgi:hypothetical protein